MSSHKNIRKKLSIHKDLLKNLDYRLNKEVCDTITSNIFVLLQTFLSYVSLIE